MGDVIGMLGVRLEGRGFDEMGLRWEGNGLDWAGLDPAGLGCVNDAARLGETRQTRRHRGDHIEQCSVPNPTPFPPPLPSHTNQSHLAHHHITQSRKPSIRLAQRSPAYIQPP